jgi:hypothetical protein
MSQILFEIQEHNKLSQKGLLKRFVTECDGHEETREEIRQQLNSKYNELKGDKNSKEYEKYFLKYAQTDDSTCSSTNSCCWMRGWQQQLDLVFNLGY